MTKEARAYRAYADGFTNTLLEYGAEKRAAAEILEKVAQYYAYEQPSILDKATDKVKSALPYLIGIPLALTAGYGLYRAGIEGDPNKSIFANSKDYLFRLGDKIVRRKRPRPWYDYRKYFDNLSE